MSSATLEINYNGIPLTRRDLIDLLSLLPVDTIVNGSTSSLNSSFSTSITLESADFLPVNPMYSSKLKIIRNYYGGIDQVNHIVEKDQSDKATRSFMANGSMTTLYEVYGPFGWLVIPNPHTGITTLPSGFGKLQQGYGSTGGTAPCQHEVVLYHGLNISYPYCKKCGIKI